MLAHDLGHTPFGHAGERVLARLMKRDGGFDHNRQSLRIVDWLEERYPRFRGLNLTYETREGILKHGCHWEHPLPVPEPTPQREPRGAGRRPRRRDRLHQPRPRRRPALGPAGRRQTLDEVPLWRDTLRGDARARRRAARRACCARRRSWR